MPNRYLRESIRSSETVAQLTPQAEVLFYRLLVSVDDFGRTLAKPALVRAACFPLKLDTITDSDIERWMNELAAVDLIRFYAVADKLYLWFTKWLEYQTPRAKDSKCPHPSEDDGTCAQMFADARRCLQTRADVPDNDNDNGTRGTVHDNERISSSRKFDEAGQEFFLSSLLLDLIRKRQPTFKKPNLQHWCKSVDLMLRRDNRTPERIEAVIRWCQASDFWQTNIISTGKLREKFDMLEGKMNAEGGGNATPPRDLAAEQRKARYRQACLDAEVALEEHRHPLTDVPPEFHQAVTKHLVRTEKWQPEASA